MEWRDRKTGQQGGEADAGEREEETGRDMGREGQTHRRETETQKGEKDRGGRDRGRERCRA